MPQHESDPRTEVLANDLREEDVIQSGRRTLVVTNDLPPKPGGIQTFVHEIVRRLPSADIVVLGPRQSGSEDFDTNAGYEIHRHDGPIVPSPGVARRVAEITAVMGCDQVMLGSGMPNSLLIPLLKRRGIRTSLVITHGNEAGWAQLPAGRVLIRPLNQASAVTYLGDFTYRILSRYIKPELLHRVSPGVDTDRFRPNSGGQILRERLGITDRFVLGTVTRLVPRKGVDALIRALAVIQKSHPQVVLLVVGDGPQFEPLRKQSRDEGLAESVFFVGAPSDEDLPAWYDAMDVFGLPTHTRKFGVDVEGLGIVFLEASASGVPVLVGASGGSIDAVQPGVTGEIIDTDPVNIASEVVRLVDDRDLCQRMGRQGRDWMVTDWQWSQRAQVIERLLVH